jgi:hypothetical protein
MIEGFSHWKRHHPAAVRFRAWITILAASLGLAFVSCNQPFDPRGPLDRQLVVFTVFSTDRSAQFVRVNSTYMPDGFDPASYVAEPWLSDASATLKVVVKTCILRDTMLARADTSRYKTPMRMFTLSPFTPERGKTYLLTVHSASAGQAISSVVIPAKAAITLASPAYAILETPLTATPEWVIPYTVNVGEGAGGYTSHLYIYYDVLKGSAWVEERVEVPLEPLNKDTTYSLDQPIYDELHQVTITKRATVQFRAGYLQTIIKRLTKVQYVNTHLIYKWIVLTVLQTDKNLFNYYKSVRGYQDPLSIRLDQPLYSRIDGGVGMVGAYTLDSLTVVLPEVFGGNR